jgi:hypothetical protein
MAVDDITKTLNEAGIDLPDLPPVMTPEQLAPLLGVSIGALANDRCRRVGVPYVKHGKRVRYLRADVARYLIGHRSGAEVSA